jgi:hypothetical protein
MTQGESITLADVLIGDIVTPHGPSEPFEYVSSVVVLGGELKQVNLPEALGEYPADPCTEELSAEKLAKLRAAAQETESPAELLSLADNDTFIFSRGFGDALMREYVAEHAPDLLGDPVLQEPEAPSAKSRGISAVLAVIVLIAVALLVAMGVWIAVRTVSGF